MSEALEAIAVTAARLVVEEGMEYAAAKRKAARELGRRSSSRLELPANEAVEDEVRTHIAIFHADTQPGELQELRRVALRWMQRLAEFRPHLAGAAWRGTPLPASGPLGSQLRLRSVSAVSCSAVRCGTLLMKGTGALVMYKATPRAKARPISRPTTRPSTKPPP